MAHHPLMALRAELHRQQLTGFVVPHTDEYQNEYLPPCAERLSWLTGFTGSAGTAIVLSDKAAIFVDGRYTIQVTEQVNQNSFSLHNSGEIQPYEWIARHATPSDRIGFDPWLHTPQEIERFQKASDWAGAQFIPCSPNPLDGLWVNRPPKPMGLIKTHPLEFSGQSSQSKRMLIAQKLSTDRIDAAIITAPDSIAWLLNVRGSDVPHTPLPLCQAILHVSGEVTLFVEHQKIGPGLPAHLGPDVLVTPPEEFEAALQDIGNGGKRILVDPTKTNFWIVRMLAQSGAHLTHGDDPCLLPKACKNPVEIAGAYAAHQRDGVAMCHFLAWLAQEALKGSVTELDAAEYLEGCRRKQALWEDCSFPTISGAGPNGAIVHYRSTPKTNRCLEPGMLFLVDSGGQYLDGTTDITRTLVIGHPSDEHRDRYTRVLQGHIALATARFPEGTTGSQLDAFARAPLWAVGLDYDHGTGHGVGSYLGVHEGPQRIAKSANSVALKPGMIVSNEPGYYKTGAYGIRLENLVTVTKEESHQPSTRAFLAFDTLTVVPFDRTLISSELLSLKEQEWIDTYHAHVWECLHSKVERDTRDWLEHATRPIG